MRFAERMMLSRGAAASRMARTRSSHNSKNVFGHSRSGAESILELQRTHGNAYVQRLLRGSPSRAGVVARQPKPSPPPDPGWSDAPKKGLNELVTTVDEKGKIVTGKATSKGVWRVPVEGLSHGLQKGVKGPAFESPGGKAVALIPNIVNPTPPDKEKKVPVDVLLHLHGHGVGYRELEPGKSESLKVLKAGQLRDVELYQMEQQLLSHVATSNKFIIAVLPQGSERSDFGDLRSNSDAYLTEVFAKLVPKYLPNEAIPGRVIVSGHSGGGPTAMAIAAKSGKRTMCFYSTPSILRVKKKKKRWTGKQ